MQAIGELDEDDANVLDHRQHHLAKAFGLRLGAAVKLDLVELADTVDQQRDIGAEIFLDVGQRSRRVFDHVVQDRSGNGLRVEMHVGQLLGDGDRVRNVGFTGLAGLALVRRSTELIGAHDHFDLRFRQIALERVEQRPQAEVAP